MDPAGLERLLCRARRREPAALQRLVELFAPRVFGLLYRLTGSREIAEELLQETFLRLVRTIGDYEHSGRFQAWLFRIATNLVRDHARRQRRRQPTLPLDDAQRDGLARLAVSQTGPAEELQRRESRQRVNAALDALGALDREIILLRHFAGLSFREIAALLEIPLGTALARAHRALKRLRDLLGDQEA